MPCRWPAFVSRRYYKWPTALSATNDTQWHGTRSQKCFVRKLSLSSAHDNKVKLRPSCSHSSGPFHSLPSFFDTSCRRRRHQPFIWSNSEALYGLAMRPFDVFECTIVPMPKQKPHSVKRFDSTSPPFHCLCLRSLVPTQPPPLTPTLSCRFCFCLAFTPSASPFYFVRTGRAPVVRRKSSPY